MRWIRKPIKIVKRFAILPIRIEDEYRWLEMVYIFKKYKNSLFPRYINVVFLTKQQYELYTKEDKIIKKTRNT